MKKRSNGSGKPCSNKEKREKLDKKRKQKSYKQVNREYFALQKKIDPQRAEINKRIKELQNKKYL